VTLFFGIKGVLFLKLHDESAPIFFKV